MVAETMPRAQPIVTIAERIKKVMLDKQDQKLLQKIRTTSNNDGSNFNSLNAQ